MKATKKQTKNKTIVAHVAAAEAVASTAIVKQDLINSILIVSVALNLAILIFWLIMQVSSKYDAQVAAIFFG
jgi:hypothetical protein